MDEQQWKVPRQVATSCLEDVWGSTESGELVSTLRYWRDEFHLYKNGIFAPITDKQVEASAWAWLMTSDCPPRLQTSSMLRVLMYSLRALATIPTEMESPFWVGPGAPAGHLITMRNGLLDLDSYLRGEPDCLHEHTSRWFSHNLFPISFDPAADCPNWLEFLNQVFDGDPQLITLLREWFGLCFTPDTHYQSILLMTGPPRGGKGTTCRTLQRIIGKGNYTTPRLIQLVTHFGLWSLVDKNVAIVGDGECPRQCARGVLEVLKGIRGEDRFTIHRKNLPDLQNVLLRAKIMIASNQIPDFMDAEGALASTMHILPYRKSFVGREDTSLQRRINGELPGIFNWACQGLLSLRERGCLLWPDAASQDVADYKVRSNPASSFLRNHCRLDESAETHTGTLFDAYQQWCQARDLDALGRNGFAAEVRALFPSAVKKQTTTGGIHTYAYKGLAYEKDGFNA